MNITSILLVQVRDPGDPMLAHERHCIGKRFEGRALRLLHRNALEEPADLSWIAAVDAVVFGGSGDYSVHHPLSVPWVEPLRHLLDAMLERDLPGFGICLGHQLLGLHLGSKIVTDPDDIEVGTLPIRLTDAGLASELFAPLGPRFDAQTGHSDSVIDVPPGVDLVATGDVVRCQGFHVRATRFYSTQFHPDLTWSEARKRYLSNKSDADGHIGDEEIKRATAYREVEDRPTELLGRFLDLVVQPGERVAPSAQASPP